MRTVLVLSLLSLLLVLGDARRPPIRDSQSVIEEIVYQANKEAKAVVELPAFDTDFHLLYRLRVRDGHVGELNTLKLVGKRQDFKEEDDADKTVYTLDMTVGLETLYLTGATTYRLGVLGSTGEFRVDLDGQAVRLVVAITVQGDSDCKVALQTANVDDFGSITVSLEPSGLFHPFNWVVQHVVQFLANRAFQFSSTIDKRLEDIIRPMLSKPEVRNMICKPFVI